MIKHSKNWTISVVILQILNYFKALSNLSAYFLPGWEGNRVEGAPGWRMGLEFHECFLCFVEGRGVYVCDTERGREREGGSRGGRAVLGKKVDIENQDLLGAGVPGHTRMGGSFSLFLLFSLYFDGKSQQEWLQWRIWGRDTNKNQPCWIWK